MWPGPRSRELGLASGEGERLSSSRDISFDTFSQMKRRITFAQGTDAPFDPDQAQLTRDALFLRALEAAREERLTFGFNELPSEVVSTAAAKDQEILKLTWFLALASSEAMP